METVDLHYVSVLSVCPRQVLKGGADIQRQTVAPDGWEGLKIIEEPISHPLSYKFSYLLDGGGPIRFTSEHAGRCSKPS